MGSNRTFFGFSQVELYRSHNALQVRDAEITLKEYAPKIKWSKIKKAIDIGCGPGDITTHFLLPLIPQTGQLLGIDIAQGMVDYAKSTHKDERLTFEAMDFETRLVGEKYASTFDFATSFYVFNMLQDRRAALKNVYDILRDGGETLIMLAVSSEHYKTIEVLASDPKWSPYIRKGVRELVSPYHHSADPKREIVDMMRDIGFYVENCVFKTNVYEYHTKELFLESMMAISPFVVNIPESLMNEYTEDYNKKMWAAVSNEPKFTYTSITVYAHKP